MNPKKIHRQSDRNGFTLIEGVICVAVVTILITFAYPTYYRFMSRSWQIEARELIAKIMNAQSNFRLSCPYYAMTVEKSSSPSVCDGTGTQSGGRTILRVPFNLETSHYSSTMKFADEKGYQIEVSYKGHSNSMTCKKIVAYFSDGSLTYPELVGDTCLKSK